MKNLLLVIITCWFSLSFSGLMEDFDSLGGNIDLYKKVQSVNDGKSVLIVQDRIVKRKFAHELSPEFSHVLGGDAYLDSNMIGATYNFHINPRVSLGARYSYFFNDLTEEGRSVIDEISWVPELDYPKSSITGHINYYPMYGKFSFFGKGIVQFDFYVTAGAGQMELDKGNSFTWLGGAGLGLWLSQHLTTRIEMRYQNFKAQSFKGERSQNLTVANLSMGYLF